MASLELNELMKCLFGPTKLKKYNSLIKAEMAARDLTVKVTTMRPSSQIHRISAEIISFTCSHLEMPGHEIVVFDHHQMYTINLG